MNTKQQALLAEVMGIDALVQRIDKAIAQVRKADNGGGGAGDNAGGSDPA
jgi:hypothetical protein